ncbi:MAG: hypothetical protein K0S92_902, partial [Desertimonas sp.]|nr:hypothetical protein [Desertimonas sp.]
MLTQTGLGAEGGEALADPFRADRLADTEGLGEHADPQLLEQPADLDRVRAGTRPTEPADMGVVAPLERYDLGHPANVPDDIVCKSIEAVRDAVDVAPDVADPLGARRDHEVSPDQPAEVGRGVGHRRANRVGDEQVEAPAHVTGGSEYVGSARQRRRGDRPAASAHRSLQDSERRV